MLFPDIFPNKLFRRKDFYLFLVCMSIIFYIYCHQHFALVFNCALILETVLDVSKTFIIYGLFHSIQRNCNRRYEQPAQLRIRPCAQDIP